MKHSNIVIICLVLSSCAVAPPHSRVRISQAHSTRQADTASYSLRKEIKWTDDSGVEHIVTKGERDSITGEDITVIELNEVTVTAKSKQVAERNGLINLDFMVTVPSELINKRWQLQLTPKIHKLNDTIYLDKIFLSGSDFAKQQKKGYTQYQAFINSIVPDSLYLKEMFDQKGYKKAMADLEEEYFQAWKNEVLNKESWIDWSDKLNSRFLYFNAKVEKNKQIMRGRNNFLHILPAYWLERSLSDKNVPDKWKLFLDGKHQITTKSISPEDSLKIADRYTDFKKIAENQKRKEMKDAMYDKYVRFPIESSRLDTIVREGDNFVYYYKQSLPANEEMKRLDLTLNGIVLSKDEKETPLPPSDTISYFVSSMLQFLDKSPRYKKKIITRKDEVNVTAHIGFKTGSSEYDENIGENKQEINKILETIRNINYTGEFLIDSIYMTATSSPEGNSRMNYQLSKLRAQKLKRAIVDKSDDPIGVDTLLRPKWLGENWSKLNQLIRQSDLLINKNEILNIIETTKNVDLCEQKISLYKQDYAQIREVLYPQLRAVEARFYLHRRDMLQDTIVMPAIDTTYTNAIALIEKRKYKEALTILNDSYSEDYNTAICLMSLGYDRQALQIMEKQEETSDKNYIMAILYVRLSDEEKGVKYFVKSCDQDDSKIWRGKLDPEINRLIETYNLYKDEY